VLDLVNGVPVHPLVVHAVVVLLPLGVLGAVAIALRAAWRERYGRLVVGVLLLAALAIPLATRSGQALAARVGFPLEHQRLGEQLIWFALPLLVVTALLVLLSGRPAGERDAADGAAAGPQERSAEPGAVAVLTRPRAAVATRSRTLVRLLAALTVVLALANAVQVYRVGDSGARAAWEGRVAGTTPTGG
jgi:heme A synthase